MPITRTNSFENICLSCDPDKYAQVFIDGHHFNLNGSLSLMKLFKKVNF